MVIDPHEIPLVEENMLVPSHPLFHNLFRLRSQLKELIWFQSPQLISLPCQNQFLFEFLPQETIDVQVIPIISPLHISEVALAIESVTGIVPTEMVEDSPDTSKTLNIFCGVPKSSSGLELSDIPEATSTDPQSVFIHPSDTEAAHQARIQQTFERIRRNTILEALSPESDNSYPIESKLDDIVALGQTLELISKDTQSSITGTRSNMNDFKDKIIGEVQQIHSDLISLQKSFVTLKSGIIETQE